MTVPSGERIPNVKFRNARVQLNLSQDGLAEALRAAGWSSCETRTIQRYESGETIRPQYPARRALPEVLKRSLIDLGFPPDEHDDSGGLRIHPCPDTEADTPVQGGDQRFTAGSSLAGAPTRATIRNDSTAEVVQILQPPTAEVGDSLDRRTLLQALAALGVATSPAGDALGEIQNLLARSISRDEGLHLDEWEEIVAEYGYTYNAQPPHVLVPDVASDLLTVRKMLSQTDSDDLLFPSWCRIAGGLAVLLAKVLSDLARHRDARMWWMTARQAAEAAGDRDLSTWVEAERLTYGIYQGRPTPVLLQKANEVQQLAPATASRGLAHLRTVRSQLLTLEGQDEAALTELDRSREVFEHLPNSIANDARSIWGWSEYRLRYTETWVNAHLGLTHPLGVAADRAYALQTSLRGRTQLKLLRAFGHIKEGDLVEGVRQASAAYEAHPADQRTVMINSLAELPLKALPAVQQRHPVVSSYRELLAAGTQRRAIT